MIYVLISFLMAAAPALILLRYFYRKDYRKPEPINLIIKVFFLGILSIFPVFVLGRIGYYFNSMFAWSGLVYCFIEAFVIAGFVEEWIKQQIVTIYVYEDSHFDEVMDGIIYTIVASLGFACFENILYVFRGGWLTALTRAFTAVPFHAGCSGLMGYYIGKAKFASSPSETKFLLNKGLVIAVFLHGLYDFILFLCPAMGLFSVLLVIPFIVAIYAFLFRAIKGAIQLDLKNRNI